MLDHIIKGVSYNAVLSSIFALSFFAQAQDPISGGAGWLGAGLLGMVLGWYLIIRTPATDRQLERTIEGKDSLVKLLSESNAGVVKEAFGKLKEISEAKDKQIENILTQKWEIIQSLTRDYKEGIKETASHCESELNRLTEYWQGQMSHLTQAIQDLADRLETRVPEKKG